jgi:NAD(P)-dependent dehydrogenase (short-subunit alcohol dehydrogenase family)
MLGRKQAMSGRDFDGFTVVVTGASTGLGRAMAVETARRGAGLVVVNFARSAQEAEETAGLVEAEGAKAVLVQGDVAQDTDCRRIAETAAGSGRIDALFNNAGITKFAPDHADLDAVDAEDFLRLYAVNVVGAFQMVRAAPAACWKPRRSRAPWSTPPRSPGWWVTVHRCPTPRPRAP